MREREKAQRPSRPPVDGAVKPRSKSSSKTPSTKPTSSSSAPKASTSTPKKSTSSSSKSSTSGTKSSTSGTKSSTSGSKSSVSTSKPSTSKTTSSSSKPLKTPGSTSSSSKPSKTPSSTSSSKTKPTLELKPEKLPISSSKTSTSSSREERKAGEGPGHRDSSRSNRTSSRRDEKTPGPAGRESRRGDKSSNRKEKDPPPSRTDKSSASRGKGERKSDAGRERARDEKSSRSQGRSRDAGSTSKSEKREHASSSRRGVGSESLSRSSKDTSGKTKSSDKSHNERSSSRKDAEKSKEKIRSSKDDKNRENDEKSKSKSDSGDRKSSRPREKSARRREKPIEEIKEDRDSGIEGLGIQGSIIGQGSKGPEVEVVEHNQNSLDTMESGISLSSPRDLSGDEAGVEESISSNMVEVDEDEAMIDGGASQDAFMDESFPSVSNYQNSMEPSTSLISNDDVPKEGGGADDGEEEDYDYEEDFEDYESDFEDDDDEDDEEDDDDDDSSMSSSSSSESTASSEAGSSNARPPDPNLAAVLQAMEKENNFDHLLKRVYSFDEEEQDERPLSPDEEERQVIMREIHTAKTSQDKQGPANQRPKTSRTFVNFAGAKKKQEAAHISSKMNSRGRALLSMIELDTVSIDLLTMSPVSYEAYISSFGHSNRQQISVQTNEDALSEDIQTDEIIMRNKWTQKPVHISIGKDNQMPGPEDYLGVGGDMDPVNFSELSSGKTSSNRLAAFLTSSSQVMLALLEEELVWETAESNRPNSPSITTEGLGFSQPPVTLGNNVQSLLEGRTTPFVQFCPNEPSMLLSGHGFHSLDGGDIEDLNDDGLLCVWWVQEPSRPQHLLSCCSVPTSASFSPARPSLVLAGLEDGSLAAWDLREPLQLHTLKIDIDDVKWRVRVPSYVTACGEGGEGEGSAIVAIHTITTEQDLESDVQGSFQVVTLTASGRVSWWVVMHVPLTSAVGDIHIGRKSATSRTNTTSAAVSPHLGASPWARIAINRAATINVANTLYGDEAISNEITCHDLKIDNNDFSQLYVATGSGAVAHCSRHTSRIHPRAYLPEIEPGCEALCMDLCPHDYRYLLVGSSDGLVRLHSIGSDRPLTSWQSAPDCAPIKGLQWSPARPCVFYVLDSSARLHIWDLSAGDIFPVMTVEAGGLVGGAMCSFNIAPTHATSRHPLYAVFASDGGEMVLRQVGPEFGTHQLQDDYDTELERFTYYVNII